MADVRLSEKTGVTTYGWSRFFVPAGFLPKELEMSDYIEEMGISDIEPVRNPVTATNAQQGFDLIESLLVC